MSVRCPECGQECANQRGLRSHFGHAHDGLPPWKDKIEYQGPYYRQQRERALERDNHQCRRCGRTNSTGGDFIDLEAHHLIKADNFSSMKSAHKLANLVMLCTTCHGYMECVTLQEQLDELDLDSPHELVDDPREK